MIINKNRKKLKLNKSRNCKKNFKKIFDLQNSSKKYNGFKNKYCYKTNIHRLIYKGATLENVRYNASNITKCNFRNAKLLGVDFCNTNLKGTSFKGAILKDVVFVNCNIKEVDFKNVKFYNTYFIMVNIEDCKEININEECKIMKEYPNDINLNLIDKTLLYRLAEFEELYKYHVLYVKRNKINMWVLKILLDLYGQKLNRAFKALERRKNKRYFYTVAAYMDFIESYF